MPFRTVFGTGTCCVRGARPPACTESGEKALQHLEPGYRLLTIGRAAALSVSLLALAGCVSAVADNETIGQLKSQQVAEAAPAASQETMQDGQEAAPGAGTTAQASDGAPGQSSAAMQPGLAMQGTALRATSSSIYGQSPAGPSGQRSRTQAASRRQRRRPAHHRL